jgi:hypothetical protein
VIVILIPAFFYSSLSQVSKDIGGVDLANRKIFMGLIDENMMGRVIPGILSQGMELEKVKVRSQKERETIV